MTLKQAYDFIDNKYSIYSQKGKELRYIIDLYDLKPKVFIAYDRLAYQKDDLRITLDFNIRSRIHDLRLEKSSNNDLLLDDGVYIMEVKASKSYPSWLIEILSQLRLYPNSFSKYGSIYKKYKKEGLI